MNIENLIIKNVKSFGEEVTIDFQDNLNIFIGPNAGGKSNLMDILNILLAHFFVYPWRILFEIDNVTGYITRQYFQNRRDQIFNPINRFLDKHNKHLNEDQEIKIILKPEFEDIKNIGILSENSQKLITFEDENYKSNYVKTFIDSLKDFDIKTLKDKPLEYVIKNYSLSYKNIEQKIFLDYLNNFDLYSLLINEYNQKRTEGEKIQQLFPPLVYFSPYRIPTIRNLVINISETAYFDLIERYKKSDSKAISSTFEVATYYFASKFLHAKDDERKFEQDEEVKIVKDYLKRLGYRDFTFQLANRPQSREKNIYEAILTKDNGEKIEISQASSGEKEIFNLLLGAFAFNIKNGVIIVDEPDLHLHPKWQYLLLELFFNLSGKRGIQFFLVTHSPHFITEKSINNVFRVYADDGESKVISPPISDESEKDLFQIVNVFNNTKIFFADKVILVEGPEDLIIYDSILKKLQLEKDDAQIIEILDVLGSGNFEKFRNFLEKWSIKSYRIADKGYGSVNEVNLYILTQGSIETYFSQIQKAHFDIDDAIRIAKMIENKEIEISQELNDIFKKIIEA